MNANPFEKLSVEELQFMVKKRQADLMAIAVTIHFNRGKIDAETTRAIEERIQDMVGCAKELAKRKVRVGIDVSRLPEFLHKRVQEEVEKVGLLSTPRLEKPKPLAIKPPTRKNGG